MRDMLAKSLEVLIWLATAFFIITSCYSGAMIIRYTGSGSVTDVLGGFLTIVFGVTMSFVFAGICFQIMDIRMFTKHMAMSLKRQQGR
ncbi:MAG: hypothetical protein AAF679_00635 [Pseudomonadota bacterium]